METGNVNMWPKHLPPPAPLYDGKRAIAYINQEGEPYIAAASIALIDKATAPKIREFSAALHAWLNEAAAWVEQRDEAAAIAESRKGTK